MPVRDYECVVCGGVYDFYPHEFNRAFKPRCLSCGGALNERGLQTEKRRKKKAARRAKRKADYFIYFISAGDCVKVGVSRSPHERLKSLQTGNAKSLVLVSSFLVSRDHRPAHRVESMIHSALEKYCIKNEWFTTEVLGADVQKAIRTLWEIV